MPTRLLLVIAFALSLCASGHAMKRGCPTGTGNYTYPVPTLPLPFDGYLPAIDNETMFLHSVRHAGGAATNVNNVLARYPKLRDLPLAEIVKKIGMPSFDKEYNISAADSTALRNNAGSVYNHNIFWRIMTTYNTSVPADNISPELAGLIRAKWGNTTAMLDALRAAGGSLFGSGWAWVVYQPENNGTLAIVTTPNQDNPIMRRHAAPASRGIPLFGVDVWEHAYYLKYRNLRASYLASWIYLIDWKYVDRNYRLAKAKRIDSIYC